MGLSMLAAGLRRRPKKGHAKGNSMSAGSDALRLISGVGAKGPACFVIEAAGKRIMLDLGEGPPPGTLPDVDGLRPLDALVISHGHKDHVGGMGLLAKLGNPPVYATQSVAHGLPKGFDLRPLPVGGTGDVLGIAVTTGRNGHAPGGVWLHFAIGDGLLYTGDFSAESILYAYDPPAKQAAVALLDCSYGTYQKPLGECWSALAPFVDDGPLLLPAPANGRGPELALEILRYGHTDIFLDEAMDKALRQLCGMDAVSLRANVDDDIKALIASAKPIAEPRGIMLAASADGTSGATKELLAQWEHEAAPAIVFTGYRAPDTPADRLIKSGRAQFLRWNVHPRLSDIVALAQAVKPRTVIPAFCDRSQLPGLAQALAPAQVTMDAVVGL
jgi:Cft2 family RNA processing exonuclease